MNSIVIARYKEDLRWVVDIPHDFEIFIYNKGDPIVDPAVVEKANHIIDRPNAGRESETYFHHMLCHRRADNDFTVFSQGDPFEHSPDFLAHLSNWRNWSDVQPLTCQWHENMPPAIVLEEFRRAYPDEPRMRPERFSLSTWGPLEYNDMGALRTGVAYRSVQGDLPEGINIASHFLSICGLHDLAAEAANHALGVFCYGAIFAVRNHRALMLPIHSIEAMINFSKSTDCYGYMLERLWLHLFGVRFETPRLPTVNMVQQSLSQADQIELKAILASYADAPALTTEQLEGSFWRLFDLNGRQLSPFTVMAPQGLLGNPGADSVSLWQIINGRLCLLKTVDATPSVVFTLARRDDMGRIISFAGQGTVDGVQAFYFLRKTEHPEHPLYATPATQIRRAIFIKQQASGTRRPNLVIVPAGSSSMHPHWLEGFGDLERSWDLCIGWYGADVPDAYMPCEYLAHIPKTKKFRLLYDLLHEDSPLWDYEAVWLPDDDLLTSGTSINVMFHLFRKFGLDLGQPALLNGEGCYPNHEITIQRENSDIRFEPFVEIMCPVFSRRALKICVGSMRDTESGYGLDHLWPALLGHPQGRMGIIDASPVIHTRPMAHSYDVWQAMSEQKAVLASYNHIRRQITGVNHSTQ